MVGFCSWWYDKVHGGRIRFRLDGRIRLIVVGYGLGRVVG